MPSREALVAKNSATGGAIISFTAPILAVQQTCSAWLRNHSDNIDW